jgi:methylglutaconyl-CoA hydratase
MPTSEILTEVSARRVATITLNRPDSGNACDASMLARLRTELENAAADSSIRIIVLRGAGRHFCSGADVRASRLPAIETGASFFEVCRVLNGLPKPTIVVVHGGCVGGGVALAACSDIVFATEVEAFFSLPEVRLGLAPGSLLLHLVRAIGERALRRYLLTGERFSAHAAHAIGLVHAVHPKVELEAALDAVIDALLLGAPGAIGRAKGLLAKHGAQPLKEEAVDAIEAEFREQSAGNEAREGLSCFSEKRKPSWYPKS